MTEKRSSVPGLDDPAVQLLMELRERMTRVEETTQSVAKKVEGQGAALLSLQEAVSTLKEDMLRAATARALLKWLVGLIVAGLAGSAAWYGIITRKH